MQYLSNLSKWTRDNVPLVFIILSFLDGGIYYKDEVKELKIWLNPSSLTEQVNRFQDN